VATVIHQNHDYAHVPNRTGPHWEGPEAEQNRALAGGASCVYTIRDASHTMTRHSVTPVRGVLPLLRRLQTTYLPPQYLPYVTNWLRRFRVVHWIYRKVIGAG